MKKLKRGIGYAACTALMILLSGMSAWAAEGWTKDSSGQRYYTDRDGNRTLNQWIYEDQENVWYYLNQKGEMSRGRAEIGGETYFFAEDGRMMTGWIYCPKDETPEIFESRTMDEDVYYGLDDGRMAKGWVEAFGPEEARMSQEEAFQRIQEDEYRKDRYCFRDNGKIYYNRKADIDGKKYIFDEDGRCMTGWIYDRGEGDSSRFVKVDDDTSDGDKALYAQTPENYLYGLSDDGSVAVNRWFDAVRPEDEPDADTRSYYADSTGYIVTDTVRGGGASITARRKATKLAEVGGYVLEDWSTDVNLTRIDGKYYCIEDSGTRIDGIFYLQGGEKGKAFPGGFYCFTDNAAMKTGHVLEENRSDDFGSDGYYYYYCFSDRTDPDYYKGQGITGVDAGRLYYQGLAVTAQSCNCEVVYLPTVAEKREDGTGMFLVDDSGMVIKGTKGGVFYTSGDGNRYKVVKEKDQDDTYGYHIYIEEKDDDGNKFLTPVTSDEAEYIYWDAVEE